MKTKGFLSFLIFTLMGFLCSSNAIDFYVGGNDGWVLKPSEDYNHWSETTKFNIHDRLVFKYKKGTDSVLVVDRDGYDTCKPLKPEMKMDDGDSKFEFQTVGTDYFISGNEENCNKGQKLITVVTNDRPPSPPQAPGSPKPISSPPPSDAGSPPDGHGSPPSPSCPDNDTAPGPSPSSPSDGHVTPPLPITNQPVPLSPSTDQSTSSPILGSSTPVVFGVLVMLAVWL